MARFSFSPLATNPNRNRREALLASQGQRLLAQGSNTSPIAHPTQGYARVLNSLLGALMLTKSMSAGEDRQKATSKTLAEAFRLGQPQNVATLQGDPDLLNASINTSAPQRTVPGDQNAMLAALMGNPNTAPLAMRFKFNQMAGAPARAESLRRDTLNRERNARLDAERKRQFGVTTGQARTRIGQSASAARRAEKRAVARETRAAANDRRLIRLEERQVALDNRKLAAGKTTAAFKKRAEGRADALAKRQEKAAEREAKTFRSGKLMDVKGKVLPNVTGEMRRIAGSLLKGTFDLRTNSFQFRDDQTRRDFINTLAGAEKLIKAGDVSSVGEAVKQAATDLGIPLGKVSAIGSGSKKTPLKLPANKARLGKGKWYLVGGVPRKWNGTSFD